MSKEVKIAFTLSEVLITIGIIGVVAAMTIPTLVASYQQMVLKNQFKKVYVTYSNALQQVVNDEGNAPACYYLDQVEDAPHNWTECRSFFEKLMSKIKTVKYCDGVSSVKECIPQYPKINNDNVDCPGFKTSVSSRAWVLSDGSMMFTYFQGVAPVFAVDINGMKKPNKGGYDLFVFDVTKPIGIDILRLNESGSVWHCQNTFRVDGGKTTYQMMQEIYK